MTRSKPAPTTTAVPQSLSEFSAQLDTHHGRTVGFADAVAELARLRAISKVIDTRRSAVFEMLKDRHDRGLRVAGGKVLRMTKPTALVTVRAVPSAVAKKAHPELWEAAKVAKPLVQAVPPKSVAAVLAGQAKDAVPFVAVPGERAELAAVLEAYELCKTPAELRESEDEAVHRLRLIAEQCGWDGLPITFADGWVSGVKRMTYDSDMLRKIAPVAWEELAVEKTTGGVSQLVLANANEHDLEDDERGIGL